MTSRALRRRDKLSKNVLECSAAGLPLRWPRGARYGAVLKYIHSFTSLDLSSLRFGYYRLDTFYITAVIARYDREGRYPFGTNPGVRLHLQNELRSTLSEGTSCAAGYLVRSTRGTSGPTGLARP